MPSLSDMLDFCPGCFASSESGSWDCIVNGQHCMNCGASGAINIPRWAVDKIRSSASWVGKRYYPHDEDKDNIEEVKALRALVKEWPGRRVEKPAGGKKGVWWVIQKTKDGDLMVLEEAETAGEALQKCRDKLPYVPH